MIPAIIAKDFRELKKKIKIAEPFTEWVQLDIMDGKFVPNETWRNPKDLKRIKAALKIEAHLMVQNPFRAIGDWLKSGPHTTTRTGGRKRQNQRSQSSFGVGAGCQRVIVHWESLGYNKNKELKKIIKKARKIKKEIGLALNPGTSWQEIEEFIPKLDLVLLMTVNPGFGGQKFLPEVIPKIRALRKSFPDVKIEVDGGINLETGKLAIRAGANILVVGSAIFESKDIKKTILELQNISQ